MNYLKPLLIISIFLSTGWNSYSQDKDPQADFNNQVDESRNFVYFNTDEVVYARNVRLRSDLFNSWTLRADTERYPLTQVKFFNSDAGFFAHIRPLNIFEENQIAERIVAGKINLFEERSNRNLLYYESLEMGHGSPANLSMFYNKGYEDLRKLSYQNLSMDMADNVESMNLLKGYRRSMNTSKLLFVSAGVSAVAGFISFLATENNSLKRSQVRPFGQNSVNRPDFTASYAMMGMGAVLGIGGTINLMGGLRKLEDAIDNYNR